MKALRLVSGAALGDADRCSVLPVADAGKPDPGRAWRAKAGTETGRRGPLTHLHKRVSTSRSFGPWPNPSCAP